ncbi:MAG: PKD domain-containing protein [Alphaproteobacteria bacterium]|nr:PKD domain-containing protein [Alphaproteobacteria bacterium]
MIGLLALLACGKPDDTGPVGDSDPQPAAALADAGPDQSVEVGQALSLDGSASEGVAYLWDFGDGQTAEGAQVEHSWSQPGRYTAVLQVTGEDGGRRTDAALITAYLPLADPPPVSSATLALDEARGQAWVLTPEAGVVSRVQLSDLSAEPLAVCAEPMSLALAGDTLGVSCAGDATLRLLSADTGALLDTVALPENSQPRGVVGRDGTWWVALRALGQLAEVQDGAVTLHDSLADPFALALIGDAPLLARWRSPDPGGELGVLGQVPWTLAVDTRPDSDTTTGGVPNLIEQLLPSPDGSRLYIPAVQHNLRRGTVLNGEDLSHETAMVAVLITLDATTGEELSRKQLDDKGRAIAVAASPLGDTLYLLHPGTATVTALDAWSGGVVGSLRDVGIGARGLSVSADGATLYVHAWLDRELRAYDISNLGVAPPLLGAAALLEEEPLDPVVLQGKKLFHDSEDPRITRDGYIACAHCHPDGQEDGRTWDFTNRGEGLRNTTSLEGRAGTGMGPVHWTGNFDEIQDFENDIRLHFAGTGLLDDADWDEASEPLGPPKAGRSEDLDALAAYVSSLDATPPSPFPAPEGGEAAFLAAGCDACHPAPLYTDSSLDSFLRHDVGTLTELSGQRLGGPLDGLDTPTLLGAWDTAPYLHDGSAETLEAAILAHDLELDEADVALIVGFVRGL